MRRLELVLSVLLLSSFASGCHYYVPYTEPLYCNHVSYADVTTHTDGVLIVARDGDIVFTCAPGALGGQCSYSVGTSTSLHDYSISIANYTGTPMIQVQGASMLAQTIMLTVIIVVVPGLILLFSLLIIAVGVAKALYRKYKQPKRDELLYEPGTESSGGHTKLDFIVCV